MMEVVRPRPLSGSLPAIPSKSYAHRHLIAAALSREPVLVRFQGGSDDIEATCRVVEALGARVERLPGTGVRVTPVDRSAMPAAPVLDCGESGTTQRYIVPVAAALGCGAVVTGRGRLPKRPLAPLSTELRRQGIAIENEGTPELRLTGKLEPGSYAIPGNVSSQFVGGLLFALSILEGPSTLEVTESFESVPYVRMTLEVLRDCGAEIEESTAPSGLPLWRIAGKGTLFGASEARVEGDWSNAAFWLCAGALAPEGGEGIALSGLNPGSLQGDRRVAEILRRMGAEVTVEEGLIRSKRGCGPLHGIEINAAQIPDLVPVLAVTAAAAEGTTVFTNAGRLRIKESDRLQSTAALLRVLGVAHEELPEGLVVHGLGDPKRFSGGEAASFNDHRIAMAAAVAGSVAGGPVRILGAEASSKSYPRFFEDFRRLGGLASEA